MPRVRHFMFLALAKARCPSGASPHLEKAEMRFSLIGRLMPLTQQTIDFIDKYCGLLNAQFNDAFMRQHLTAAARNLAFHKAVGSWHHGFRQCAVNAMADLNATLLLLEGDPRNPRVRDTQLRHHILTSGVGSLNDGFLVLTANPGHSGEHANRGEVRLRKDEPSNVMFGADFFSVFPQGIERGLTHTWWRKVLRVARRYYEPPCQWNGQHTPQERWNWAVLHGGIGCVDLFPFHSKADGLSPCVLGRGNDPDARAALRRIADATLDMAIRARPKVLFIASRLGAYLVTDRGWEPVVVEQVDGRALLMYCRNGVPVFVYAAQLFSGRVRGITNDTLHQAADTMRRLISQQKCGIGTRPSA